LDLRVVPEDELRLGRLGICDDPDDEELVHELIEEQGRRSPEAVAVESEEEELSYGELHRRSGALGRKLRLLGVGPEERVGVCVRRGTWLVAGVLGVLKAGGVYVPLDADYPAERLRYQLRDAAPRVVLVERELRELLGELPPGVRVMEWGGDAQELAEQSGASTEEELSEVGVRGSNAAYVIYTSGSTGVPKGVVVEHRQLAGK